MFGWTYVGVNASIPRNVGPGCSDYLPMIRKIGETTLVSAVIIGIINWCSHKIIWPKPTKYINQNRDGRKFLLVLMSLVFGIEIGFKLSSQTLIYILNPCHIVTALQIYLLAADPSPLVTVLFRIHLNFLNGPVLAYAFPETECRLLWADKATYYIQHGLMVVIPYYLLRIGGIYNIEPMTDLSWPLLAYAINLGYHFWVLQLAGGLVQVNLSHMLCPAVLDPFEGQNYRMWAFAHQLVLCPVLCRTMCIVSKYFLTQCPLTRIKPTLDYPLVKNAEIGETLHASSKKVTIALGSRQEQVHYD